MPRTTKRSNLTYHDNVEQGSPEWLQLREYKFTGSNAYKLLTSFGAGSWAMAKNETWHGNFYTKRGHILEEEALGLYEQIKGVKCDHAGFVTNTKYPNCLYSPDAYREDRTVEVKCFSPKEHLKTIKNPSVKILAQCHFGQIIMERNATDLVLYCPKPSNWDERWDGEWPVPVDKMLVILTIKKDKDIHNNFKGIIKEYNENRRSK